MIIPSYLFFQFVSSVLVSMLSFSKTKSLFVKKLFVLLWVVLFVESLGVYFKSLGKTTGFFYYHIYIIVSYSLINFMYYKLIRDNVGLLLSKILWIVLFVYWVLIFFDSNYFPYAQIVGSINVGLLVFLYFKELLLSNEIIDYKKLLPFWVSIGFAIFYLGSIPFFALWNYFKTDGRGLFYILEILVVMMNVFISIGLIIKLVEANKNTKKEVEKINR